MTNNAINNNHNSNNAEEAHKKTNNKQKQQTSAATPMEIDDEITVLDNDNTSKTTMVTAKGNTSKKTRKAQKADEKHNKRQHEELGNSNDKGWTIVKNPYKKVQSNSTNRRLCTRGPSLLQMELTPDRTNRALGVYNHRTRVTVKLTVEASDSPQEAILNALQGFFDEFQNADSEACARIYFAHSRLQVSLPEI